MGVIVLRLFFISTTSSSSLPFFTICFRFSSFVSYIKRWKDSIQLTKQTTKSVYSSLFVWRMEDNVRFKRRNTSFTLETALMNSLSKRPTKVEKNANWIHIQYEAWVAVAIIIILFFFSKIFFPFFLCQTLLVAFDSVKSTYEHLCWNIFRKFITLNAIFRTQIHFKRSHNYTCCGCGCSCWREEWDNLEAKKNRNCVHSNLHKRITEKTST